MATELASRLVPLYVARCVAGLLIDYFLHASTLFCTAVRVVIFVTEKKFEAAFERSDF